MATSDDATESTSLLQRPSGVQPRLRYSDSEVDHDVITCLPSGLHSERPGGRRTQRSASVPYNRTYSIGRTMSLVRATDLEEFRKTLVPQKDKEKIFCRTFAILFSVMLERCTYFSVVGNLVLFCTNNLVMTSTMAVTVNLVFTGIAFIVPLFAGRIADTLVNRFNTIYACYLMYIVGAIVLPLVAFDYIGVFGYDSHGHPYGLPLETKKGFFGISIIFVAIGAGGIKANISPFGAQQVEPLGQEGVQSFFNWFYWFVNFGGFVAYMGVVYVQQQIGFFYGYLIPCLTLILSLILFTAPRNSYTVHDNGNVFGFILAMFWEGSSCGRRCCRGSSSEDDDEDPEHVFKMQNKPDSQQGSPNTPETGSTATSGAELANDSSHQSMAWLDRAKISYGGSFLDEEVENVKSLIRTLPVFFTLILFSTFTSQTTTTMLLQGERMNPDLGSFAVPAAMLNVFKMIIIVILLPILDRLLYPALQHIKKKPTLLQRIGFGMVVAVLALICMGSVEIYRKNDLRLHGGRNIYVGKITYNASDVSIMWQMPQFILTGVADAFTLVTALEFSYTESPVASHGLMMGINHLSTGLGNFLASILYNTVASATEDSGDPWLPDELNDGHLEYYVFLLAGILFLNFLLFLFIAYNYKYNELGVVVLKRDLYITVPPKQRPKSQSIVEHMFFER